MTWTSWAVTDVGTVRAGNEDAFVDLPSAYLWAVADGAGGHQHGEVAAQALKAALEAPMGLAGADLVGEVRARVASVHQEMRQRADQEAAATGGPVTIASTLVVLLAHGPHFACLWCGDSRAYMLRAGVLSPLTRDHSMVQEMVDAGVIDADAAERHPHANVLTRAIGADGAEPELDKITGMAESGDRFLLCSDGLFKALDTGTICRLVAEPDPARALIQAALAAAARDNVTAVVIQAPAGALPNELSPPMPAVQAAPDAGMEDGTVMSRPAAV